MCYITFLLINVTLGDDMINTEVDERGMKVGMNIHLISCIFEPTI